MLLQLFIFVANIFAFIQCAILYKNVSYPMMPGLEPMSSSKHPHFSVIESVSKTKTHRHRRQVIAGPIYEWQSNDIHYQIWGGDGESLFLIYIIICF